ncbi:phosphatidylinositol 4-phosphate 3-kinase C2 domain-containing subunit beta-like [Mauremys mutica]|uniref:phosphatidylinositol 4-phosphate 3-kinase C2 domain-containing subunit beta-like n=1 Tax=Mauremys mutica TaxID=74926 RepID=UPI001D13EC19|nr:phosphatidylinositol 4-phosphate 3-kinase C2 domain-containing subunit beta-like [Mauremys mutica]
MCWEDQYWALTSSGQSIPLSPTQAPCRIRVYLDYERGRVEFFDADRFPSLCLQLTFTSPPAAECSPKYEFHSLGKEDQCKLKEVMQKESLYWLTDTDRKRLWEKRYYCHEQPGSLPLLLTSAPSWEWACLPDIYALLKQWTYMNHQDALGLLHATFPDQEVRRTAIHWIDSMSDAELLDYLPQLVQALKYECYLDSPLVRFLMKRAICDLRITPLLLLPVRYKPQLPALEFLNRGQ